MSEDRAGTVLIRLRSNTPDDDDVAKNVAIRVDSYCFFLFFFHSYRPFFPRHSERNEECIGPYRTARAFFFFPLHRVNDFPLPGNPSETTTTAVFLFGRRVCPDGDFFFFAPRANPVGKSKKNKNHGTARSESIKNTLLPVGRTRKIITPVR